jgi:uncharacterized protein (DUF1778 family)
MPRAKTDPRTATIRLRVTEAERERIYQAAERLGQSVSHYVRDSILRRGEKVKQAERK